MPDFIEDNLILDFFLPLFCVVYGTDNGVEKKVLFQWSFHIIDFFSL